MEKRFGALSSSTDPDKLANTVRGVILMASSVIILLASKLFGITLTAEDITSLATVLGSLSGAIWVVYGLIQKVVVLIAEKKV